MGKIIAVVSGKGGTGKTSFTATVGIALANSGARVVCMDCDIALRNLDLALGLSDRAPWWAPGSPEAPGCARPIGRWPPGRSRSRHRSPGPSWPKTRRPPSPGAGTARRGDSAGPRPGWQRCQTAPGALGRIPPPDFLIVAFAMFLLVKTMNKIASLKKKEEEEEPEEPEGPTQEELLAQILEELKKKDA